MLPSADLADIANPEETSQVVVEKLIAELKLHDTGFEPQDDVWTLHLDNSIRYLTAAQKGIKTAQLYALAVMRKRWNELPLGFRKEFQNDFWFYACLRTGRQMKRLEALIDAVETFMLEEVKPFGQITIPKREDDGTVIEGEFEYKEFDVLEIDPSKLVAVKSRAVKGQMTDDLWAMLVDDAISVTEIQIELSGGKGKPDTSMKFYMDGPYLTVQEGGVTVEIGEITAWDEYYSDRDSLQYRAIKRLCSILDMHLDEEVILNESLRSRRTHGHYHDNEGTAPTRSNGSLSNSL